MTTPSTLARRPSLLAAAAADPARLWRGLGFASRMVLSACLFAAALWLAAGKVDWRQVTAIGVDTAALCLLLCAMTVLLLAWRWRIVTGRLAAAPATLPGLACFARLIWIGLAVNQMLPTVLGGDALRIVLLTREGMPAGRSASSVVADRLYGLLGLAVLCLIGIPLIGAGLAAFSLQAAGLAVAATLTLLLLAILAARHWSWLRGMLADMRSLFSWRAGAILIPAAIAAHVTNISIFLAIAYALGADLPLVPAIAVMSLILLATALPLSIAGWGLRELTLVQAFSHMGAATDKILLASVIYGLFLLFTQASGFLLLVGRDRP